MKKAATQDQQDFAATLHAWVKSRVSTLDELEEVSGYNRCDLSRMSTGGRIANDFEIDCIMQAIGIIDARLCRTTAKEREMSEVKIDWKNAPEGATHYNTSSCSFFKRLDSGLVQVFAKTAGEWEGLGAYTVFDLESSTCTIKRPESITDVARSIEAARVEERKHSHYFKDVSSVAQIDVYSVLRLFEVTDPCLQHIVKKALCAGKRGAKDFAKDVQEIADTAARLIELERGE